MDVALAMPMPADCEPDSGGWIWLADTEGSVYPPYVDDIDNYIQFTCGIPSCYKWIVDAYAAVPPCDKELGVNGRGYILNKTLSHCNTLEEKTAALNGIRHTEKQETRTTMSRERIT